jgi:acyl-CoA thioester hydrolase
MVNAETGVIAAICELSGVHMDRATRRAVPFPVEVGAAFLAGV